jgi:hypothetical protein
MIRTVLRVARSPYENAEINGHSDTLLEFEASEQVAYSSTTSYTKPSLI